MQQALLPVVRPEGITAALLTPEAHELNGRLVACLQNQQEAKEDGPEAWGATE